MTRPFRFLADGGNPADSSLDSETIDSDFVVIMAAMLCALICVIGLVAVVRCAWVRRINNNNNTASAAGEGRAVSNERRAGANKGLKKKILRSLPVVTYSDELAEKFTECAICLTDFGTGDDVRILPQCGHGFHVGCIDTWLGSHSSCPSCRQILIVATTTSRCENCGGVPNRPCGGDGGGGGGGASSSTGNGLSSSSSSSACDANRFLP